MSYVSATPIGSDVDPHEKVPVPQTPSLFVSQQLYKTFSDDNGMQKLIEVLNPEGNVPVIILPDAQSEHSFMYPRDMFQVYRGLICTPVQRGIYIVQTLLGRPYSNTPIAISKYGIGGFVLRSGNLLIVPDEMKPLDETRILRSHGYDIGFLPVPHPREKTALSDRMCFNNHLDSEVNIVSCDGTFVFVVNIEYYRTYPKRIESLLRQYNGELVVIEDPQEQTSRRGVNFLELPSGHVVVPSNCHETIERLRRHLPNDRIHEAHLDCSRLNGVAMVMVSDPLMACISESKFETLYFHGGLRCMVNVVGE